VPRAGLLAVLAVVLLSAGCSGGGRAAAPATTDPGPSTTVAVSTTAGVTTTTKPAPTTKATPRTTVTVAVAVGPGDAHLAGTVTGPQGPVDGATVRVERLVGKDVATMNVTTAGGSWRLDSILGGSYRVRAFKTPDLAQAQPEVFFLAANDTKTVDLKMDRYDGDRITAVVNPNPPLVGQAALLTIQVGVARVDDQGRPAVSPRPGVHLQVAVGAALTLESAAQSVTDANGSAGFTIRCLATGTSTVSLTVGTGVTPVPLPACAATPVPPSSR
jgi:hypothetical protein